MTNPNDPYQQGQPPQYQSQPQNFPAGPTPAQGFQQPGYPQQGQPQQGYPQGGMPPVNPQEFGPVVKPKAVDTAFMVWLVAAGIGLVGKIVSVLTIDAVWEKTKESLAASGLNTGALDAAKPGPASAVFGIVVIALWVAVVFAMRGGANWARILLTVLGGISIAGTLFGILGWGLLFGIGFLGVLEVLLSILSAAAIVAGIVFMFKPESTRYFKAR